MLDLCITMTPVLSTEKLEYPIILVGGPRDGHVHRGKDRPKVLQVPIPVTLNLYETYGGIPNLRIEVATYYIAEIGLGGWNERWPYYYHKSITEHQAMLMFWGMLLQNAWKTSKAADPNEEICRACNGKGTR